MASEIGVSLKCRGYAKGCHVSLDTILKKEVIMKVIHYTDEIPTRMDNDVVKGVSARVLIGQKDGAENFCMRLFQLDEGGHTPCHEHKWEHEIFFHQGEGEIFLGDSWNKVTSGSAVFVPGHVDHQIRNIGKSTLTFVCLIPSGYPEL